jgi:hypothetical protein
MQDTGCQMAGGMQDTRFRMKMIDRRLKTLILGKLPSNFEEADIA